VKITHGMVIFKILMLIKLGLHGSLFDFCSECGHRSLSPPVLSASLYHSLTFRDHVIFKGDYAHLVDPRIPFKLDNTVDQCKESVIFSQSHILAGVNLQKWNVIYNHIRNQFLRAREET
jgi:hypothetical protein